MRMGWGDVLGGGIGVKAPLSGPHSSRFRSPSVLGISNRPGVLCCGSYAIAEDVIPWNFT